MRSITLGSRSGWPSDLRTKIGSGTPQTRCRDTHQSGRLSIIDVMRLRPCSGTKLVLPSALSAPARRPFSSIEMNHWAVLRKISGALDRHEWG